MPGSTVPVVVPALRALWQPIVQATADTPGEWKICTGHPAGGDIPDRFVAVAYGGGEPGAERIPILGGSRRPELANPTDAGSELYAVWNTVCAASGEDDIATLMSKVDVMYQQLVQAVVADNKLGGVLVGPNVAFPGAFEWLLREGGGVAEVHFQVQVDAGWV